MIQIFFYGNHEGDVNIHVDGEGTISIAPGDGDNSGNGNGSGDTEGDEEGVGNEDGGGGGGGVIVPGDEAGVGDEIIVGDQTGVVTFMTRMETSTNFNYQENVVGPIGNNNVARVTVAANADAHIGLGEVGHQRYTEKFEVILGAGNNNYSMIR